MLVSQITELIYLLKEVVDFFYIFIENNIKKGI